jgi:hypothetical protein
VSLPRDQLKAVAQLLHLPSLFLYDSILPPWTPALYPSIASLTAGGKHHCASHVQTTPHCCQVARLLARIMLAGLPPLAEVSAAQPLSSAGGEPFVAFAKASTPLQRVLLYESIIEPYFSAGAILLPCVLPFCHDMHACAKW